MKRERAASRAGKVFKMQDTVDVQCAYCGQPSQIALDYSAGTKQTYYEDCQVCCRLLKIHVDLSRDDPVVSVEQGD